MKPPADVPVPRRGAAEPEIEPEIDERDGGDRAGDASAKPAPAGGAAPAGLSEREQEILAFERQWWKHAGAKEQAIRERFDLSATRYYRLLNALLDNPAALERDPVTVRRLRRLRSTRARSRTTTPRPPG